MNLPKWIPGAGALALLAWCAYGLVTDTGPAGWVNYAQSAVFGSYSVEVTGLLLFIAVGVLFGLAASFVRDDGGANSAVAKRLLFGPGAKGEPAETTAAAQTTQRAQAAATEPTAQAAPGKVLAAVGLGFVAVTWAVGYGAWWWLAAENREDAAASYEKIVLADNSPAPQPSGRHVQLEGRLLGDHILTHRSGQSGSKSDDYHLVPVASPSWRPGQPVDYVVKIRNLGDLAQRRPAFDATGRPAARDALLARMAGDVAVPAAQEFRKNGVALSPAARLVRWVPSKGERPDVHDTSTEDLHFTIGLCTAISAVIVLTLGLAGWMVARQRRRMRAGAPVQRGE